jgi:hypothetical protein
MIKKLWPDLPTCTVRAADCYLCYNGYDIKKPRRMGPISDLTYPNSDIIKPFFFWWMISLNLTTNQRKGKKGLFFAYYSSNIIRVDRLGTGTFTVVCITRVNGGFFLEPANCTSSSASVKYSNSNTLITYWNNSWKRFMFWNILIALNCDVFISNNFILNT